MGSGCYSVSVDIRVHTSNLGKNNWSKGAKVTEYNDIKEDDDLIREVFNKEQDTARLRWPSETKRNIQKAVLSSEFQITTRPFKIKMAWEQCNNYMMKMDASKH